MKKLIAVAAALVLAAMAAPAPAMAMAADFADVPKDHWAYADIHALRGLGVIAGEGDNTFGIGKAVTRAQFAAFLANLMAWEDDPNLSASFSDNADPAAWYYGPVEAARQAGATDVAAGAFRPNDNITREEMAVMLVNAMGWGALAEALPASDNPFTDVVSNGGYIAAAKDFGLMAGVDAARFLPGAEATREQAAVTLMRLRRQVAPKSLTLHGFYAIRSAPQMGYIPKLDSVGFGWARMELDGGAVTLNATSANSNEYNKPAGYEEPLAMAKANGRALLMVTVQEVWEEGRPLAAKLVTNPALRTRAAEETVKGAADFDGVVIDFESLKGEAEKAGLNAFLTELKAALGGTSLYVAVHPARRPGQEYFDGYDFKTIGELADKVILMAHDYNAKSLTPDEMARGVTETPLAPISEVYYALKAITDPDTGVKYKSKVLLQINFDTAQWKTSGGAVLNESPYRPDYAALEDRMRSLAGVAKPDYDEGYESPVFKFTSPEDGEGNVVWFEDGRSVAAKMRLAKHFDVGGLSLWRLGNIPENAWTAVLSNR